MQYFWRKKVGFPHPVGIVIGQHVTFGLGCKVFQGVTIGGSGSSARLRGQPKIGSNVTIYTNSVVVGGITVGDNSTIGANSFVDFDVPENSLVIGSPGKIVKQFDR